MKWQDGKPFISADVAYSIQLLRQVHPRARTTFANVTEIATPDPDTVVITLSKPAPYLIKAFSSSETPILPKHLYEGTDPLTNPANNAPIGTGPFRFVKWVRGSYIEYVRNDYWDNGKPYLDRIIVKVIDDPAARTVAFEDGSVDLSGDTPVPLSDLDRLKANPTLGLETRGYEFQAGVARLYTTSSFRRGVPFTNGSHYSNPEIDRLFSQVAEETDEVKRKQLFSQIQRILERDLPDINLVSPQYLTVYSRAVHNHTTSPDGVAASFADVWLQR